MRPKVSVLIPVYNTERYLRECLDSVVAQTLKEIEIICINDGSTDSSLSILREYAGKDSRIRILDKPNTGYGDSMNRALDASSGEYIGIVESDDFVEPDMYEKVYTAARSSDADAVFANAWELNGKNTLLRKQLLPQWDHTEFYREKLSGIQIYSYLLEKQWMDYWSGVYKKDFLNRNHIRYNPTPGASYQYCGFFYKVMYCQPVTRLLNEAFYHYRTDNPDSSVRSTAKVACIHDEFLSICEFIEKNPENRQLFVPVFSQSMTGNYLFNYHRIAENRQVEFLNMMRQDLSYFLQAGVFSWKHLRPSLKIRCRILFASPCLFQKISLCWNLLSRLSKKMRKKCLERENDPCV